MPNPEVRNLLYRSELYEAVYHGSDHEVLACERLAASGARPQSGRATAFRSSTAPHTGAARHSLASRAFPIAEYFANTLIANVCSVH